MKSRGLWQLFNSRVRVFGYVYVLRHWKYEPEPNQSHARVSKDNLGGSAIMPVAPVYSYK